MIGIELDKPCKEIANIALHPGLLVYVTQQSVIQLLPPLVIQSQEIAIMNDMLEKIIAEFYL